MWTDVSHISLWRTFSLFRAHTRLCEQSTLNISNPSSLPPQDYYLQVIQNKRYFNAISNKKLTHAHIQSLLLNLFQEVRNIKLIWHVLMRESVHCMKNEIVQISESPLMVWSDMNSHHITHIKDTTLKMTTTLQVSEAHTLVGVSRGRFRVWGEILREARAWVSSLNGYDKQHESFPHSCWKHKADIPCCCSRLDSKNTDTQLLQDLGFVQLKVLKKITRLVMWCSVVRY